MAFMMPVVKNDWDIYKGGRPRHPSESADGRSSRTRKISETRSEGPASAGARAMPGLSGPHRSAPAIRSSSYCRAPPSRSSRASLGRPTQPESPRKPAGGSPQQNARGPVDKFHNRLVDRLKKALGRSSEGRSNAERSS